MSPTPPQLVREGLRADLDVIDAAYERVRATNTDSVGQAFWVELVERLAAQERVNREVIVRVFGELAESIRWSLGP